MQQGSRVTEDLVPPKAAGWREADP